MRRSRTMWALEHLFNLHKDTVGCWRELPCVQGSYYQGLAGVHYLILGRARMDYLSGCNK